MGRRVRKSEEEIGKKRGKVRKRRKREEKKKREKRRRKKEKNENKKNERKQSKQRQFIDIQLKGMLHERNMYGCINNSWLIEIVCDCMAWYRQYLRSNP